ncbi:pathogenicity island 1 effector protein [Salmonella enterica subsp. enterica]|uniref:Pathogenicity island 1 effector protein n=1 Tax=Salmonella enterica I TaxID=59201 RepID=A0A379UU05_SALET|nr:pathogenicity island 1 effector protein [Salmonella enterica subsp. enterica]
MEKKSAEFQEETRKAEETNRIMGCIGKVLGALLTIVSVVAAVFTGGASLALAAVGLCGNGGR